MSHRDQTPRVRSADLVGTKVVTRDAIELGEVVWTELELSDWSVTRVGVRLERPIHEALDVAKPLLGCEVVAIPTREVSAANDVLILESSLDQLEASGD